MAALPPYFDGLIEAFNQGHVGRHVHLGFWDDPPPLTSPCSPAEFEAAQARLTERMIALAGLADDLDVLDVGCGFGGALASMSAWKNLRRTGVNIDPRQLGICASVPTTGGALAWVAADACALPFPAAAFDRVFCIEAMFHFSSRDLFLSEAARVLRPGGRLVVSDILLRDPGGAAPISSAEIRAVIAREFGPWPRPWIEEGEIIAGAKASGLAHELTLDASRQTLPSYRVTAPQSDSGFPRRLSAGHLLRWLHRHGFARYLCLTFVKS